MKNVVVIIIILVVGGGAFYGGTLYEKNSLQSQGMIRQAGNGANGQTRGQGQGGGRFGANGGANGANGSFATGQIISQDSSSITIKSQDGSTKIVYFSGSTTVGKTVSGSSSDLTTGEQVMVQGKANSDGSIAAQNIQIRPSQPNQNPSNQNQPNQNQNSSQN
jgi:hypothetical protein